MVTVGFPSNQAVADDIDGVPTTGALDTLTSARLETIIGTGATAGSSGISATVTLPIGGDGRVSFDFDLRIWNDEDFERAENFTVTISIPIGEMTTSPGPTNVVTTTIVASDLGTWAITPPTQTVNEGADASYTVEYDGNPATQGETVEILVTVGFTLDGQAVAADIDGDTGTPGPQDLTSPLLVNIIRAGITSASITGTTVAPGDSGISATVTLTADAMGDATFSFNLTIADDGDSRSVIKPLWSRFRYQQPTMTSLGPNA